LIAEIVAGNLQQGRHFLLQWGRDQLIAEIWRACKPPSRTAHASMGPRSIDRGNVVSPDAVFVAQRLQWGRDQLIAEISGERTHRHGWRAASMGPRSIDRGNETVKTPEHVWLGLQWGRDQLIAEIRPSTGGNKYMYLGFNGAAIN